MCSVGFEFHELGAHDLIGGLDGHLLGAKIITNRNVSFEKIEIPA